MPFVRLALLLCFTGPLTLYAGVGFITDLRPEVTNEGSYPRDFLSTDDFSHIAFRISSGSIVHLSQGGQPVTIPGTFLQQGLNIVRVTSSDVWTATSTSLSRWTVPSGERTDFSLDHPLRATASLPDGEVFFAVQDASGGPLQIGRTAGVGTLELATIEGATFRGRLVDPEGVWVATQNEIWRFPHASSQGSVALSWAGTITGMVKLTATSFVLSASSDLGVELYHWIPGAAPTLIRDINPGSGSSTRRLLGLTPSGHLLFTAYEPTHGDEFWITDGTPAGTSMVFETAPGSDSGLAGLSPFLQDRGLVVYTKSTHDEATIYAIDGDGSPVWSHTGSSWVGGARRTSSGGVLFIRAGTGHRGEYFHADLQTGTIETIASIGGDALYSARLLARLGSKFVSVVRTAATGEEPWLISEDGSTATLIGDFTPPTGASSHPKFLGTISGVSLLIAATGESSTFDLWRTDGSSDGTQLIASDVGRPDASFSHGNLVYFNAGNLWWRTDGIVAEQVTINGSAANLLLSGTELYAKVWPGWLFRWAGSVFVPINTEQWSIDQLSGSDGRLYFSSHSGVKVLEPESDQPRQVSYSSSPSLLGSVRGRLLLDQRYSGGEGLWALDGTAGEEHRIGPPVFGYDVQIRDGWLWARYSDGSVLRTDGTPEGTAISPPDSRFAFSSGMSLHPAERRAVISNGQGTFVIDPPAGAERLSDEQLSLVGSLGGLHLLAGRGLYAWDAAGMFPYQLAGQPTGGEALNSTRRGNSLLFSGYEMSVGSEPAIWEPEEDGSHALVSLRASNSVVAEGSETEVAFVFEPAPVAPLTINVRTRSGSASDADYEPFNAEIPVAAGQQEVRVQVRTRADALAESDESFVVLAEHAGSHLAAEASVRIAETGRTADISMRVTPAGHLQVTNKGPYTTGFTYAGESRFLESGERLLFPPLTWSSSSAVAVENVTFSSSLPDPQDWNHRAGRLARYVPISFIAHLRIPCAGVGEGLSMISLELSDNTRIGTTLGAIGDVSSLDVPPEIVLTGPLTSFAVKLRNPQGSATMAIHEPKGLLRELALPTLAQPCRTVWPAAKADPIYNGRNDLLARDRSTGSLIWYGMTGTHVSTTLASFGVSDFDWQPEVLGDFNGDSRPDLVWRNYATGAVNIWFMDGTSYIAGAPLFSVADPAWKIEAASDFNNDGKTDLIWRNYTTGDVNIWYMDGTRYISGANLFRVADPNWEIRGADDFNFDGQADLMWRNRSTGDVNVWYLHGGAWLGGANLFQVTDPQWDIVAVGDYDGDGLSDLIWQHSGSGSVNIWQLDGGTYLGGRQLFTSADEIVGPR